MASWSCRAMPKKPRGGGRGGWESTISDLQKLGPPSQLHRESPAFLGQLSAPNVACIGQSAILVIFTAFSCVFARPRGQHHEHQLLPVLSQSFRTSFRPCPAGPADAHDARASIMSISCSPSSLASPLFSIIGSFLRFWDSIGPQT